VPLSSEHMHVEAVQPTLLLLADANLAPVNELYRKAFNRALSGDASGAVTAGTSAVEEMFRTQSERHRADHGAARSASAQREAHS
jgi:hypothetical protein